MNATVHDGDDEKRNSETCHEHQRTTITLPRGVEVYRVNSCNHHGETPSRKDHQVVSREGTQPVMNGPADRQIAFHAYRHKVPYRGHRAEYIERSVKHAD